MKILFLNWRDMKNPRRGGAEVVTEEVAKRLVARGHSLTLFTASFKGGVHEEVVEGYRVVRRGSEYTVHLWAFYYWFTRFRKENFDVVVDQIHGVPFFTPLYVKSRKSKVHKVESASQLDTQNSELATTKATTSDRSPKVVAFAHEVARDIWLHMYPFPIGRIGYILEPFFYKLYKRIPFITVSEASKRDLVAVGIPSSNIDIIPEAIPMDVLPSIPAKDPDPTIVIVGRVAKMKGVGDLISAYRIVKKKIPNLKLWIAGGGDTYKDELMRDCANDPDITFYGYIPDSEKIPLYSRAHVFASASIKEGFGLVVIEAAAHGTPSVVYNVDGFNEAVVDGETGILTNTNPEALAEGLVTILSSFLSEQGTKNKELNTLYTKLQQGAYERSKSFNFDNTADVFEEILV